MRVHRVATGTFNRAVPLQFASTVGKTRTRKLPNANEVQDFMQVNGACRFSTPIPATRRI